MNTHTSVQKQKNIQHESMDPNSMCTRNEFMYMHTYIFDNFVVVRSSTSSYKRIHRSHTYMHRSHTYIPDIIWANFVFVRSSTSVSGMST